MSFKKCASQKAAYAQQVLDYLDMLVADVANFSDVR
jgi:hypothetical protein